MKLILKSIVAGLLLVGLTGCGSGKEKTQDSTPKEEVVVKNDIKMELTGKVGKYPIEMILIAREGGGKVFGQYRSTRTGSGAYIAIAGEMDKDGNMELVEESDGHESGRWQVHVDNIATNPTITGELTNRKGVTYDVEISGTSEIAKAGTYNSVITVDLPSGFSMDDDDTGSYSMSSAGDDNDSDEDWDAFLRSYEQYVNDYIVMLKKASKGDPTAIKEYVSLYADIEEYQEKLSRAKSDLTSAQISKLNSLNAKLANAISTYSVDPSKAAKAMEKAASNYGGGDLLNSDDDDDDNDW